MKVQNESKALYQKYLAEALFKQTGIKANKSLQFCEGGVDCPQFNNASQNLSKEFILVAHNPQSTNPSEPLRIPLPSKKYKPLIWKKEAGLFVDAVDYDILQQQHFGKISENGTAIKLDYMMFLDNPLDANEIAFIKIIQTETEEDPNPKLSAADT